jgi:hypothetical protein
LRNIHLNDAAEQLVVRKHLPELSRGERFGVTLDEPVGEERNRQ